METRIEDEPPSIGILDACMRALFWTRDAIGRGSYTPTASCIRAAGCIGHYPNIRDHSGSNTSNKSGYCF